MGLDFLAGEITETICFILGGENRGEKFGADLCSPLEQAHAGLNHFADVAVSTCRDFCDGEGLEFGGKHHAVHALILERLVIIRKGS